VDEIDDFSKSMGQLKFSFLDDFSGISGLQIPCQRTHMRVDLAKNGHIRVVAQLHHSVPLPRSSVFAKAAPIHFGQVARESPYTYAKPVHYVRGSPYITADYER
jgi:hypothetical protein